MRGYLLMELLCAILVLTISITCFAYYRYYKVRMQDDAIKECRALSLARNEIERASEKLIGNRTYIDDIFTISCTSMPCGIEGFYQKQLRLIEVEVAWMCMNGTRKSVFLTSVV